jgi:hypothetical protein
VTDVFEHADADHLVETPVLRQIAVVEQLQLDLVLQPFGFNALAGQGQLPLLSVMPNTLAPNSRAAYRANPPQPQPTSSR